MGWLGVHFGGSSRGGCGYIPTCDATVDAPREARDAGAALTLVSEGTASLSSMPIFDAVGVKTVRVYGQTDYIAYNGVLGRIQRL